MSVTSKRISVPLAEEYTFKLKVLKGIGKPITSRDFSERLCEYIDKCIQDNADTIRSWYSVLDEKTGGK